MDALTTFLEGLMAFISPCVLPMLPVYVLYFTGGEGETKKGRTLLRAVCFVMGFTLLFVLLGVFAGTLGALLIRWQRAVAIVTGAIIVLFGLHFAGILRIGALEKTLRPDARIQPTGYLSCLLLGAVFSAGWTPCTGPMLGSAMMLAAGRGSAAWGAFLLLCYGLGLGVPFIACALAIDRLKGAFERIKRHYDVINRVCGAFLILVGLLMATGLYARLPSIFSGPQEGYSVTAVKTDAPEEVPAVLEETPAITETPNMTQTPAPTETPKPTETPEPTETPSTTQTPAPTDEPKAEEAATTAEMAGPAKKAMAANFTVYEDEGGAISLSDLRGRPVIVNFFASWCGPCQREMPLFETVYQEYGDRIEFMMVDLCGVGFDSKDDAKAQIAEAGYTFPVYFDENSSAVVSYVIRSIPTSVFVSADGELIGKWVGMIDEASLRGYIDMLLAQ